MATSGTSLWSTATSTPSLVSSSVVSFAETASSSAWKAAVADLGEVVVADDRGDVLGRLGVLVVLEHDEAELGDGRLGRAQLGEVDGLALEGLGDRGVAGGERLALPAGR